MKRNCVCITSESFQRPGVAVALRSMVGATLAVALAPKFALMGDDGKLHSGYVGKLAVALAPKFAPIGVIPAGAREWWRGPMPAITNMSVSVFKSPGKNT